MIEDNIRLLIVDDDDVDRERTRRMLLRIDPTLSIDEAESFDEATQALQKQLYHCLLVDYRLGRVCGLTLLKEIRLEMHMHCAVIMLTGLGDENVAANALRLGASDYLQKSQLEPMQLMRSITNAVHRCELEKRIYELAHFDPLTGLINRAFFIDRLQQRLVQIGRDYTLSALCFLDLDNFKAINDEYGHQSGDLVLQQIAQRILGCIRSSDTVCRLGGDEFVVLLNNLNSRQEVAALVNKFNERIQGSICVGPPQNKAVTITASTGITMIGNDITDAETLLRQADQCMYIAKRHGKNRSIIFDPEKEQALDHKLRLIDSVLTGLKADEFVLYYQPKFNLKTHEIVGVEALLRWIHPTKGLLAPEAFTDALHDPELSSRFGEWVIQKTLHQIRQWNAEGIAMPVSINISVPHFQKPDFSERLAHQLSLFADISPALLELEILETVSISDMERTVSTLSTCRKLGVKVALDDFGTGYSSLRYLKNLPLDTVKIDRCFVQNILTSESDLAIVKSIVTLTQSLGLQLIAEGIESTEQEKLLLRSSCLYGQGHTLAPAMPAEELADWLRSHKPETKTRRKQSPVTG